MPKRYPYLIFKSFEKFPSTYFLSAQSSLSIFAQKYLHKCKDTYFILQNNYLRIYEENCQIQIEYIQSILDTLSVLYYWLSLLSVHKEKKLFEKKYISQSALLLLYIYQVLQELLSISNTQPKKKYRERESCTLMSPYLFLGICFWQQKANPR